MISFNEFIWPEGNILKTTRPRDVIWRFDGWTKGIIRLVTDVSVYLHQRHSLFGSSIKNIISNSNNTVPSESHAKGNNNYYSRMMKMIEQSNKIQLKATYIYLMIWAKNSALTKWAACLFCTNGFSLMFSRTPCAHPSYLSFFNNQKSKISLIYALARLNVWLPPLK